MRIDCDTCLARDLHCGDCVVSVLLGMPALRSHDDLNGPESGIAPHAARVGAGIPASSLDLDPDERVALAVLAEGGLVPPLRVLPGGGDDSRARTDTPDRALRIAHEREVS
jgi:hypothetical protein